MDDLQQLYREIGEYEERIIRERNALEDKKNKLMPNNSLAIVNDRVFCTLSKVCGFNICGECKQPLKEIVHWCVPGQDFIFKELLHYNPIKNKGR